MKKTTLSLIILALFLALGASALVWQKEKKQADIKNQMAQQQSESQPQLNTQNETPVESEQDFSPQHIVAIPGSGQVWYEIPEMGIKLLLSKEVAGELVYRYSLKRDSDIFVDVNGVEANLIKVKDVESVAFFLKKIVDFENKCDQLNTKCKAHNEIDYEFYIGKVPNVYHGERFAFNSGFLKQFPHFYLIGASRRESYGMSDEEFAIFETTVQPYLPNIPSLKDIRIELLENK